MINKFVYKCSFCGKREGIYSLIDKETLTEIFICKDCNAEIIIQQFDKKEEKEFEKKLDDLIDCEIDYLKEKEFDENK
jgi:transcription elongation factor Elf1